MMSFLCFFYVKLTSWCLMFIYVTSVLLVYCRNERNRKSFRIDIMNRRRRMEREAKAKVIASVWGAHIFQFLAALAVLLRSINPGKIASAARNLINSAPQTDATSVAFASVSILFYGLSQTSDPYRFIRNVWKVLTDFAAWDWWRFAKL